MITGNNPTMAKCDNCKHELEQEQKILVSQHFFHDTLCSWDCVIKWAKKMNEDESDEEVLTQKASKKRKASEAKAERKTSAKKQESTMPK